MTNWLKKNWFTIGILVAVSAGVLFPRLSLINRGGIVSVLIVMVLFFNIGFTLPSEAIRRGLTNFRLHLFLQLFIFIATPFYFYAMTSLLPFSREIRIGLLALSVLPTTVSTCIVFTQSSGGNTVGTMFNAVLANGAGVFLSPLILSLLLKEAGRSLPVHILAGVIISLSWKMLLPLLAGQLFRMRFSRFAENNKRKIGNSNNGLILFLILLSLAGSASDKSFFRNLSQMGPAIIFVALSFYILTAGALLLSRAFKFSHEDVVSIIYTAPQKTLAMGVPLLSTYFAGDSLILGLSLIPLLFYHPWQIINAGILRGMPFMRNIAR